MSLGISLFMKTYGLAVALIPSKAKEDPDILEAVVNASVMHANKLGKMEYIPELSYKKKYDFSNVSQIADFVLEAAKSIIAVHKLQQTKSGQQEFGVRPFSLVFGEAATSPFNYNMLFALLLGRRMKPAATDDELKEEIKAGFKEDTGLDFEVTKGADAEKYEEIKDIIIRQVVCWHERVDKGCEKALELHPQLLEELASRDVAEIREMCKGFIDALNGACLRMGRYTVKGDNKQLEDNYRVVQSVDDLMLIDLKPEIYAGNEDAFLELCDYAVKQAESFARKINFNENAFGFHSPWGSGPKNYTPERQELYPSFGAYVDWHPYIRKTWQQAFNKVMNLPYSSLEMKFPQDQGQPYFSVGNQQVMRDQLEVLMGVKEPEVIDKRNQVEYADIFKSAAQEFDKEILQKMPKKSQPLWRDRVGNRQLQNSQLESLK